MNTKIEKAFAYEVLFVVGYKDSTQVGHIRIGNIIASTITDAYVIARDESEFLYPNAIVPSIDGGFTTITENGKVLENETVINRLKRIK